MAGFFDEQFYRNIIIPTEYNVHKLIADSYEICLSPKILFYTALQLLVTAVMFTILISMFVDFKTFKL